MPRTSEITVTQRASTKLMKISQNFHENFTKISFENSLVPDEMYAFPYIYPLGKIYKDSRIF